MSKSKIKSTVTLLTFKTFFFVSDKVHKNTPVCHIQQLKLNVKVKDINGISYTVMFATPNFSLALLVEKYYSVLNRYSKRVVNFEK